MSLEEYQHKFAVVSAPEDAGFEHIESIIKKSGFSGRYLIHFSKLSHYTGFVLEMDKMPAGKELKKLGLLELKEIDY